MLLKAIEGPSAFGRLLGSKIFGSEDECYVICRQNIFIS